MIDNLIVDTGSSNTWVGAVTPYSPTSTSEDTGGFLVSFRSLPTSVPNANGQILKVVTYGSGFVIGEEFIDTVSLGDDLTVANQSIGVADFASGFSPYDGILGYAILLTLVVMVLNTDLVLDQWI